MIVVHYSTLGVRRCDADYGADTWRTEQVTCLMCMRLLAADMGRMAQMATQLQRAAIQRAEQLEGES